MSFINQFFSTQRHYFYTHFKYINLAKMLLNLWCFHISAKYEQHDLTFFLMTWVFLLSKSIVLFYIILGAPAQCALILNVYKQLKVVFVLVLNSSSMLAFCSHFANNMPVNKRKRCLGKLAPKTQAGNYSLRKLCAYYLLSLFCHLFCLFSSDSLPLFHSEGAT